MGHSRVGWAVSIFLALGASGMSARASETPVYLVTGGTAFYNTTAGIFSFSGPNFDITFGAEDTPPGPTDHALVTAGSVFGAAVVSGGSNFGSGTAGGISYPFTAPEGIDFFGSLVIKGAANLPNPPITIGLVVPGVVVSGPASFTGSLTACAPFFECVNGSGANIGTNIFILDFNNTGIATFHLNGPVGAAYNVFDESFTLTPEPETWLLYATGLLMIGLVLWRKHQALAV
jgi:hypothetical protein